MICTGLPLGGHGQVSTTDLYELRGKLAVHLDRDVLRFWTSPVLDREQYRGFLPLLDNQFDYGGDTTRNVVVTTRLLYNLAVAIHRAPTPKTEKALRTRLAVRVRDFKSTYWDDHDGGFWWDVNTARMPATEEKKTIAQLYALYVLAEIHRLTGSDQARELALEIYDFIDKRTWDAEHGGYLENYEKPPDGRANQFKTIGTHLHGLLGTTKLNEIAPDPRYQERARALIEILTTRFEIPESGGNAFNAMTRDWKPVEPDGSLNSVTVYPHTAELVWYTLHAARLLKQPRGPLRPWAERLADGILKTGVNDDGAVYFAGPYTGPADQKTIYWWSQTEVLVMLMSLYELTGDEAYLRQFRMSYEWTMHFLAGDGTGCWVAFTDEQGRRLSPYRTGGNWKAGLHVIRCLFECGQSLERVIAQRSAR